MSSEQPGGTPGSGAVSDRMRALLSRAAEEQLHEQRQVSTVLGELRSLVEDVDERLATGEQLERVAEQVRALSASVEARLDAAETRSVELAERIGEATEMVGRAAHELVEAVAARVAERLEAHLHELAGALTASVDGLVAASVASSERRLAVHVDDAVLALAEVVLRRGQPAARPRPVGGAPRSAAAPADELRSPAGAAPDVDATLEGGAPEVVDSADEAEVLVEEALLADARPPEDGPPEDGAPAGPEEPEPSSDTRPEPALEPASAGRAAPPDDAGSAADPEAQDGDRPGATDLGQALLVPADVEHAGAVPSPLLEQERRTAERRTSDRGDGTGRRHRPWWRAL